MQKLIIITLALLATNVQAKPLPIIETHQPQAGVDAGCGKGKPIYIIGTSKVCKLPKQGTSK